MTTHPVRAITVALVAALAACGGHVEEQAQPAADAGVETSTPTTAATSSGPVVYRAGYSGAQAVVMAVHADTGEVTPFGPPLPLAANANSYFLGVSALVDGRQVVSAMGGATVESSVLVGDGSTWTVIAHDSCRLTSLTSPGQTLVRLHHDCGPPSDPTESDEIIRPDGTSLWKGTSASPAETVIGMAPDDSYAVIGESPGLSLWTAATGTKRAIQGTSVDATFATSLVVDSAKRAAWLDLQGNVLDVPSFDADVDDFSGASPEQAVVIDGLSPFFHTSVQLQDGELSALADRSVVALQPLPSSVKPLDVAAVLPGHWTVVQPNGGTSLSIVGPDGVEAPMYGDPTLLAPATPPFTYIGIVAQSLVATRPWILVEKDVVPTQTASSDSWATTLTLVFPGDPTTGVAPELHDLVTAPSLAGIPFFTAPDGRYLLYIANEGVLHSVDVTTQTTVTTPAGYLFQ